MSVTDGSDRVSPWADGECSVIALVGAMNCAVAQLVRTIRMLIDTEGWAGHGIHSVEHWVTWKAGMSRRRAGDLTRVARRMEDLPACWALFEAGRLTEDAIVRIAGRVPAARDSEIAELAPLLTISQLTRILAALPETPDGQPQGRPDRERSILPHTDDDGWGRGSFRLPPDEMARFNVAMQAARDAEFRDHADPAGVRVEWADAFMRLVDEGLDALDATLTRTGHRGERTKVVLHHDLAADGTLGPGQVHLGPVVPESVARFLRCDAEIQVVYRLDGRIVGIDPTQRTANRALRRAIERRDQGCTHPLCTRRVGLHLHHLQEWSDGGPTLPFNLICLCERHHRDLHVGDFTIDGNPEDGTLRFLDRWGQVIEPPDYGPPPRGGPTPPTPFTPPLGERLDPTQFTWN